LVFADLLHVEVLFDFHKPAFDEFGVHVEFPAVLHLDEQFLFLDDVVQVLAEFVLVFVVGQQVLVVALLVVRIVRIVVLQHVEELLVLDFEVSTQHDALELFDGLTLYLLPLLGKQGFDSVEFVLAHVVQVRLGQRDCIADAVHLQNHFDITQQATRNETRVHYHVRSHQ